ncbi:MAG: xanthine dehydrogenase family protein molybdopterin-binding subunit [Dehalococcoidia bacterium]
MTAVEHEHPAGPFLHARWYGTPIKRREDPKLITGHGIFVDDITLPGMLSMAYVRSPHAHAHIRGIDATAARAMPGVVAVITADEAKETIPPFPPNPGPPQPPRFLLARDTVRVVGEAVAVVLAEDRYQAVDAVESITVEYEELPAVTDLEAALEPDAPQLWEDFPGNTLIRDVPHGSGDIDAAFAAADVVVRQRMTNARLAPAAIETRGVVANFEPWLNQLTVWSTTQAPHRMRWVLSRITGLPEGRIRVIAPEMGGGFGAKGNTYNEETLACVLSQRLGRPVKWIETRSESFSTTQHGRGQIGYIELAARRDGTILGMKLRLIADMGYTCNMITAGPPNQTVRLSNNVYRLGAAQVTLTEVFTNKPPTGPYRGAGRPEAVYFMERAVDLLARELAMDPAELRRKNFIPKDAFPYRTVTGLTYDSGDYHKALETLLESCNYDELKHQRDAARAEGRLAGIGLSCYVESTGGMPGGWEYASVRVDRAGAVSIATGISAHGQGHETTLSQIGAEVLGVPMDSITVYEGDTALVPEGTGTMGSRSMVMGGSAVYLALRKVEEKMRRIAADMLDASPEDLRLADGRIEPVDAPGRGLRFAQVAAKAYGEGAAGEEPGLHEQLFYRGEGTTYPFGAYLCMVEIDRETGRIEILRFDGVDDCGPVINPLIVAGQVHGGIAQGVGQALCEEVVYDESGQLISGTFMDYAMPFADTMPHLAIGHTITPSPLNPLGLKGVGEAGTIGSVPAVANAVMDALAPLGIRHLDLPLTPLKVWQAIQEAGD